MEKKTGEVSDPITSENTIELSMHSTLALSTVLDINSKIEIGDGEDKISEDRKFHIGTKGNDKVDHSYSFPTTEEMPKESNSYKPIEIKNRKAQYPNTGGPGAWIGFTIGGLAVMIGGAYIYHKRRESIEANS